MIGHLILVVCGCALVAIGFGLLVRREDRRVASRLVARTIAGVAGLRVRVSEFCPPGKAYIVDLSVMGLGGGGRMLVIHPSDYRTVVGMRGVMGP